ncbi:hypothetical protein OC842_003440 [Tilletia horrida]|uniref:Arginine decarboxylase n=1 Tax=Tilletia horrida TaxID=155126 RepID=A0AAN6GBG2_9BASI|nr:hypothetical protein OC842_003440 [Tilletia horrida]
MAPSISNLTASTQEQTSRPSWTADDAAELYGIKSWGQPWFSVNAHGKLCFQPALPQGSPDHGEQSTSAAPIEVEAVVEHLIGQGLQLPLSLHWTNILEYNAVRLFDVWDQARREISYGSDFRGVLPMKVNCLNGVAPILLATQPRLGVECGTLAELLLAIGLAQAGGQRRSLIVNGFKSEKFIEATLRAAQLPIFNPSILVFDRVADINIFTKVSQRIGLRPSNFGVRARLAARGAGKHASSTGAGSKFGMSADEIIHVIDTLRDDLGLLDSLSLLHFHIGSQVSSISALENAFREGAELYCRLRELGATGIDTIDVGGGLAIKYDNTDTSDSSADYDWLLYARTALRVFADVCDRNKQPRPHVVTESGRALTAQHAMIVFDVEDTVSMEHGAVPRTRRERLARQDSDTALSFPELEQLAALSVSPSQDQVEDVGKAYEEAQRRFTAGGMSLAERGRADRLRQKALDLVKPQAGRGQGPSHQAMINMSLFQSLNHVWTLRSVFPTIPLQRLDEQPDIRAVLTDLTCDSLGVVDKFQALGTKTKDSQPSKYLPMHRMKQDAKNAKAEPYRIAMGFSGAYNALLNGRHNLFGTTDSAGIRVGALPSAASGTQPRTTNGSKATSSSVGRDFVVEWTRPGDTVEGMLRGIGYDPQALVQNVAKLGGQADSTAWYGDMLAGSTYPPSSAIGEM